MQNVQRRAGVERVVQVPRQPGDIPHIVDIRRIFARLDARPTAVPEHLARIRVRDPKDQPVSCNVVGYGAAGVVGAGEVVEAWGRRGGVSCQYLEGKGVGRRTTAAGET